ncbi:MAG: winged helix-turn-helix domain-containing protein [Alteromonadaceae bacterium]|nr:winged helix-turn-helix domain-containing protein [Alteromonadaceae bacterium]
MRWRIGQWEFCDQQQTLTSGTSTQQLEPMVVELLSYFCRHTGRLISKDELIEQVWLSRIVSDNAVSKLVTKLRKALNDDVKQPRYIATLPKKGYKFIAEVVPIQSPKPPPLQAEIIASESRLKAATSHGVKNTQLRNTFASVLRRRWVSAGVIAIALLILLGINWLPTQSSPVVSVSAKTLTTDAGDELFAAFSPDGTRVAYMREKEGHIDLLVKELASGQIVEIKHPENPGVGPGDWRKDGKQIAYLVATPERCEYYLRDVDGMTFGAPDLIHTCPAGSYGKILFTHDNNRLIYAESTGGNAPYSLFELNLQTRQTKRLNQPELHIGGNSQFDLHPTDNKLLISSPDNKQYEGFYSLNLDTGELTLLFEQNAYICCGIWDHSGERVILMGEHPAYELLSYDLNGDNVTMIYSGSRIIRAPRRHINGTDYVFTSSETNFDVNMLDVISGQTSRIADDSVDERLASFANHTNQIALVSLASGSEEIWLTDFAGLLRKKLTDFNDGRHYLALSWSPDGLLLAGLTLNAIHVINTRTGNAQQLDIPQTEIRGVSFKTNNSITFSLQEGNRWRAYTYQLSDQRIVPEAPQWQFIQYHPDARNTLWLSDSGQLFAGDHPTLVTATQVPTDALLFGRQFNLKKRGERWYWFNRQQRAIEQFDASQHSLTSMTNTAVAYFDVAEQRILFGTRAQGNSNLYQTQTAQ